MTENYDVVVIGGGIIGNSIAMHLANEKLRTAVVNSSNLGTPASIAAAGLLTPFQINETKNPLFKDFCFKSYEYFDVFLQELQNCSKDKNIDLGFKKRGALYLIFSNYEIAHLEKKIKELKNIAAKISFLNKQEVLKHEPQITKEIIGAYHYPSEGFINNPKLLKAINQYCLERKVTYTNSAIKELNISKSKIESLTLTNNNTISGGEYILCNGAWANSFLKKIFNTKEDIIGAIKGEILEVGVIQKIPLQKIIFCQEGYILPRLKTNELEKDSILTGSTSEEINIETNKDVFKNTVLGISHLTKLFQKIFPGCKDLPIINHWCGLRPKTKDCLPIIDKCQEVTNLYLALGHYRNGILCGPYTGKIIRDLIINNKVEFNIEPFKIKRLFKPEVTLLRS